MADKPKKSPLIERTGSLTGDLTLSDLLDQYNLKQYAAPAMAAAVGLPIVGRYAKPVSKALGREAARRMEQHAIQSGLIPHVVKPEGGQWADPAREKLKKTIEERASTYSPEVGRWLSTVGNKYFLNRMGSPSDDIRLLLEQNISHLPEERLSGLASDLTNTEKDILRQKRRYEGFPAEGVSDTAAGKRWELMTDEWINPNPARVYQDPRFLSEAPWAAKLDPSTPIYSNERGMNYLITETGMPELASALTREIKAGNLRPEQLNKVSLSDAVKLAHAQRLAEETALAKDLPLAMELPEGYSMRELTHEDPNTLRKILEREGKVMQNCIGGYCEDVTGGSTRLFSLRDPAGNPHVNIEVEESPYSFRKLREDLAGISPSAARLSDEEVLRTYVDTFPALGKEALRVGPHPKIKQIKGKQNEAPSAEYIPYVQQFIKEQGPFREIRDLGNAGMLDLRRAREHGVFDEDIPGLTRELNRIFPSERNPYGGSVLSGQHGVRISPDQMTRELLRNMEGNYTSTPELMQYLQRIEPRPIEHGYSKYWNTKEFEDAKRTAQEAAENPDHPANFAEGGAVDVDHPDPDSAYEFRDYGKRVTGEEKEQGALGEVRMPDGRSVMTEFSINPDNLGEMPSMVEGMHPADLNYLRNYAQRMMNEEDTGEFPEGVRSVAIHSAAKRRAQGKSPFWNRAEDKGFAEGGLVDPFAGMSYPEKFALLARGAKKRYIDYYDAANKHGEYPDILAADLKSKYPVELGTSRENRTPLDVAINYGGGYDFAANPSVPARDVRDMAKAYQLWDYMTSFRDKAKADAIGDYYENMAGVEAGLAGRGKGRMPQEDIVKASAAYGKRKATASPAYDTNFAEGGEVDYDSMYEFK